MRTRHIISMMTLATLVGLQASARCLRIDKNTDCPGVGSTAYYQDEESGRQYIVITNCEGKTCRRPFTGPIQPQRVVATPVAIPTDWAELTRQSLAITTPGADIPLYFTDANGIETHFRTPIDSAEDAYYAMLYLTHERTGLAKAAPVPPPDDQIRLDPSAIIKNDPDWKVSSDIFGRYIDTKYPPGTQIEELVENTHVDLGVMGMIDDTHSNLTIRQMPSPGNGMQLIVAPIAKEIASPITVTRADGTLVWSGGGSGESSTIDLAGQPSGMYFVRGLGKAVLVQIVR